MAKRRRKLRRKTTKRSKAGRRKSSKRPSVRRKVRPPKTKPIRTPRKKRIPRVDIRKALKNVVIDTKASIRARREKKSRRRFARKTGLRLSTKKEHTQDRTSVRVRLPKNLTKDSRRVRALRAVIKFRGDSQQDTSEVIRGKVGKFTKLILFTDTVQGRRRWHPVTVNQIRRNRGALVQRLVTKYEDRFSILSITFTPVTKSDRRLLRVKL